MRALSRLDRVYPALTAKERARLVLQAWKDDGEGDSLVRTTMPPDQAREFNRYIGLMNGANQKLGAYLIALGALVDQVSIKYG